MAILEPPDVGRLDGLFSMTLRVGEPGAVARRLWSPIGVGDDEIVAERRYTAVDQFSGGGCK